MDIEQIRQKTNMNENAKTNRNYRFMFPATAPTDSLRRYVADFDRIEIKPCKFEGYDQSGHEIVKPCELRHVSIWAVYGHYGPYSRKQGEQVLDDFETRGEAQKFCNRLIDLCPELAYRRPRRRRIPQSQLTL